MKRILITGADGYLGSKLALEYLENTDQDLVLWVRAQSASQMREKVGWLAAQCEPFGGRVLFAYGDLRAADALSSVDPSKVRGIVHAAAATAFNVDADTARAVNVVGATRVMDLARRCSSLEWFSQLSTVYASGLATGVIEERPLLDPPPFGNHYEASKWAAERALVVDYADLPWRIMRVATVIADDESGRATQSNVVHKVQHLMFGGLLPIIPGSSETRLYFATGQLVVDAVRYLSERGPLHSVYHLCHDRASALTLKDCLDCAYETFLQDPGFAARRILRPLFTDEESFEQMANHVGLFAQGSIVHVVSLMRPFAKQMFLDKDVKIDQLRRAWPGYTSPDYRQLMRRLASHLLSTRWGTEPPRAASSAVEAAE